MEVDVEPLVLHRGARTHGSRVAYRNARSLDAHSKTVSLTTIIAHRK